MKLIFLKLTLILLSCASFSFAQEKKISGMVSDEQGVPLPGVNVIVKASITGTQTDFDGNYTIDGVLSEDVLVFSYIGYQSKEITVGSQQIINIQLSEDTTRLNEVVLTGYGSTIKKDLTGSIASISSKNFNGGVIVSPEQLLVGKLAGVQITPGGGAPGSGATIRIRGGSSLSAKNDPLFVVDGMPLDNGVTIAGSASALNFINPNDIESVTVLKDASATAIYGARASNGVVIITTKSGKKGAEGIIPGSDWKFSYSSTAATATKTKTVKVLSADEFRQAVNTYGNENAINLLGQANTNWQDKIFQTALTYNNNISGTGSLFGIPVRASIGYLDNNGILLTDNLKKLSASISVKHKMLNDKLKVHLNILGTKQNSFFADDTAIANAIRMDPTKSVFSNTNGFGGYYEWFDAQTGKNTQSDDNPVAKLKLKDNQATNYRSVGNFKLEYTLPMLPDLKTTLNMGYDYSETSGEDKVPDFAGSEFERNGKFLEYSERRRNTLLDFYLNYNKKLNYFINKVDITAGYSYQRFYFYKHDVDQDYLRTNIITDFTDANERFLVGFVGRANLNMFNDKLLLTTSLRYDGSSRFSEDNRWGIFPSLALAWNVKEQSFLKEVENVEELKLRLGYGITGQENIGGAYPYLSTFTYSNNTARYQIGDRFVTTARPNAYDVNVKWEEQTSYNFGIDYSFFNSKIYGNIDIYKKETNDLLIDNVSLPLGSNLNNQITTNVGSLENTGFEILVSSRVIDRDKLNLNLSYNVSYNDNKLTKLTLVDNPNFKGIPTGDISGGVGNKVQVHQKDAQTASFFLYQQVYDGLGKPIEGLYADINQDGLINENDLRVYRPSRPNLRMGFNSNMTYNNFDFSFSLRMVFNNYLYNNQFSALANYSDINTNASRGYLSNISANVLDTNFVGNDSRRYFSDYYVEKADYLRMDYITLGYTFRNISGIAAKINGRLYITVQNAFVLTNYQGIDPEVEGGIDNNFYPRPRTFLLGLNINL